MAFPLHYHLPALFSLLVFVSGVMADADFTLSKASYYPNSDTKGTENGACEYGTSGATLNNGDVSASASLYRNGVGCGACYQLPIGEVHRSLLLLSRGCDNRDHRLYRATALISSSASTHAFAGMGQSVDAGAALLTLGYVGIEYKRVSCSYPNKNIVFKITESSHFPYYIEFEIWYQQGSQDIIAVQLCENVTLTCQLLSRTHGAVWATVSPPTGPLYIRMLFSSGAPRVGDQKWLAPTNTIPQNWTAGAIYDSGVQMQLQKT